MPPARFSGLFRSACYEKKISQAGAKASASLQGQMRPIHPVASAARALNLADATPTTLPRSSTSAPPELPGGTGRLIWKCHASASRDRLFQFISHIWGYGASDSCRGSDSV